MCVCYEFWLWKIRHYFFMIKRRNIQFLTTTKSAGDGSGTPLWIRPFYVGQSNLNFLRALFSGPTNDWTAAYFLQHYNASTWFLSQHLALKFRDRWFHRLKETNGNQTSPISCRVRRVRGEGVRAEPDQLLNKNLWKQLVTPSPLRMLFHVSRSGRMA